MSLFLDPPLTVRYDSFYNISQKTESDTMPICMVLSRKLEKYICDNGITEKIPGLVKFSRKFGKRIILDKAFHLLHC